MNTFENIKNTWKNASEHIESGSPLTAEVIQKAIVANSTSVTSKLLKSIKTALVIIAIDIILFLYNSYFYMGNLKIISIIAACLILSTTMFLYLILQAKRLQQIDRKDSSLREILVEKIEFFNKSFYWVIQSFSVATALLPFAINLTQESADGAFNISKIFLLIAFYISVYLLSLTLYKITHSIYLKQLQNALANLDANVFDEMEKELKRNRKIRIFIAIFLSGLTIAGIIIFLINMA